MALEAEFWEVLEGLAASRGGGLAALVASIDAGRAPAQSLASALRLACLRAAYDKPEV